MNIVAVKTPLLRSGQQTLCAVLAAALPAVQNNSVIAISSKAVALCEGRTVPMTGIDKPTLISQEASQYVPADESKYEYQFTITQNLLAGSAGIDASNGDGQYVLWPADPQATAHRVAKWLRQQYGIDHVGVVIIDSTSTPMRLGSIGMYLAHSGFAAIRDYRGESDLFGHTLKVSRANIANSLAAAANVVMGEGAECTPLAVITDVPFVHFAAASPTADELKNLTLTPETDLFEVFFRQANWQPGGKGKK